MAPDPRLDEIQARLSAATPGPWGTVEDAYRSVPILRIGSHVSGSDVAQVIMHAAQDKADANFIANAPADLAYLLAELRKAHEALTRVEEVHQPRQFNPISDGVYFGQSEFNHNICAYDHEHWPCPTAAAVAAANGDTSLSDQLKRRPANRVAVDALKAEMLREVEAAATGDGRG